MTDQEFDVLDELYFVQSFEEVMEASGLDSATLRQVLEDMQEKGWIRVMSSRSDNDQDGEINIRGHYDKYFYLATKSGLMAHNSR